ncbi:hypothetical protein Tco_1577967 [Tanacetum coccineum]
MANLSEDIQCAGSDTRPPMLDRTDFASWQQRIRLYCRGKENGVNILKSIDEGPFQMGTFRETLAEGNEGALHLGPERLRVYSNLSPEDKDRTLGQVKMLWEVFGSELIKEDRESQLYDDFKHFCQHKGETIHDYYVQFAKLINDMRNIKMTMSRMQLNSKFVNNMLPEWGRFVTAVKLNRGLRNSNYDQLTSSNPGNQATDQDGRVVVQNVQGRQNRQQGNNARDAGTAGYRGAQNRVGNANPGQARQVKCYNCNSIGHEQGKPFLCTSAPKAESTELEYFKDKMVTLMMYLLIMYEPHAQSVSKERTRKHSVVVDNSLTAELATYKEQVELYERRARILDFKQKENKYLEEFLDMKALKEKVEDRLYKQDQSLQTVHMLCKPKPYYNELNKVAIGYKNPLCLTRAKQVQPALYNGYEIVKNNHVPAIVHNTEDTLEIAEITRRKMHDKMKDPECVTHKVKIAPPDYSKENYLATFTPQKQLTPEQIFWSQDIIKMKAKALKEQTTASRPTKALTVYPPNTPATLVPRVLPTKSQVKINIFALIQLFSDFEKTCNKRITPTGLTEGERGFEQTKACYLTEVIPFFKTLKEHFEGIQKALTKEVKEMKEIFKELEAEVDQHVVDRKHDEIERKNLLIANDNLIANCLFKDVFHVLTNSELNVSSFTEMHDPTPILKHVITRAKHLEQTTALLTENESLKVQIQNKLSCINKDHVKPKVLAPGKYAIDVEPIPPRNRNNREVHLVYLKHLKESVETLREIVEEAKVERPLDSSLASACLYTKHSQELLEYVIGTCPKDLNTRDNKHASTPLPKKKSQPRSNTKKNRILLAKSVNMKK